MLYNHIISQQFINHLKGKVMVVLEKTFDHIESNNIMEQLITSEEITINEMHREAYSVENNISFTIVSNTTSHAFTENKYGLYVISYVKSTDDLRNNAKYFSDLAECTKNEKVVACFYHQCLEIAKNDFDFDKIPNTTHN